MDRKTKILAFVDVLLIVLFAGALTMLMCSGE